MWYFMWTTLASKTCRFYGDYLARVRFINHRYLNASNGDQWTCLINVVTDYSILPSHLLPRNWRRSVPRAGSTRTKGYRISLGRYGRIILKGRGESLHIGVYPRKWMVPGGPYRRKCLQKRDWCSEPFGKLAGSAVTETPG